MAKEASTRNEIPVFKVSIPIVSLIAFYGLLYLKHLYP